MRGTGPLPGLKLLACASFLSGFCFELEERSDSRGYLAPPESGAEFSSLPAQTLSAPLPPAQPLFLSPPPLPTLPLGTPDLGFSSF